MKFFFSDTKYININKGNIYVRPRFIQDIDNDAGNIYSIKNLCKSTNYKHWFISNDYIYRYTSALIWSFISTTIKENEYIVEMKALKNNTIDISKDNSLSEQDNIQIDNDTTSNIPDSATRYNICIINHFLSTRRNIKMMIDTIRSRV